MFKYSEYGGESGINDYKYSLSNPSVIKTQITGTASHLHEVNIQVMYLPFPKWPCNLLSVSDHFYPPHFMLETFLYPQKLQDIFQKNIILSENSSLLYSN